MQISIAAINDYCDRHLDSMSKKYKPIPRGLVSAREALCFGLLLTVIMFLLLLPLNPLALYVTLLYLLCAHGYNLGLKSTPFSGIVFALAIPLIPLYAFVGVGHVLPSMFWLVPAGSLLGIALNLANSLPDIEADALQHARTLAVALGVRRTLLVCPLLILLCTILTGLFIVTGLLHIQNWLLVLLFAPPVLVTGVLLLCFGPDRPLQNRKLYFYLMVFTSILLGGGWLIGVIA
jgi:4-hydroxybenzoate polyprenyltransferase